MGFRLSVRWSRDPRLLQRPFHRSIRDRAQNVCDCDARGFCGVAGIGLDRAAPYRHSGPRRRAKDEGLDRDQEELCRPN